ncbi:MAG: hypothetical protein ABWY00_01005 [Dongiaceae bacterium]
MALSFPKAVALISLAFDPNTQEVVITLKGETGTPYEVRLHPGIVSGIAVGLFGIGRAFAPPDGTKYFQGQVLQLTGSRKAVGPAGQPILDLELEGGMRFPVTFPVEALEVLKNELTQLQEMTKSKPKASSGKLH